MEKGKNSLTYLLFRIIGLKSAWIGCFWTFLLFTCLLVFVLGAIRTESASVLMMVMVMITVMVVMVVIVVVMR